MPAVDELTPIVGRQAACRGHRACPGPPTTGRRRPPVCGPPAPRRSPPGAGPGRGRRRGRDAQLGAVLRQGPGPGLGHASGRGHLPGLDLDHVPAPASTGPGPRAPGPGPASGPGQTRAGGDRVPTRCGAGTSPSWPAPTSGPGSSSTPSSTSTAATWWGGWWPPGSRPTLAEQLIADAIYRHDVDRRSAHPARRPGSFDDLADGQPAAGRPRCPPEPLEAPPVQRQPLLRSPSSRRSSTRPTFPKRFANIAAARSFCDGFFEHYNHEHRHSGIGLHTPADVHFGLAEVVREKRQGVLDAAYAVHAGPIPGPTPGTPDPRGRLDQPTRGGAHRHAEVRLRPVSHFG